MTTEDEPKGKPKTVRPAWWRLAFLWWHTRGDKQFRRNQALFMRLLKDPRSGLEEVCRQHAHRMANAMMMNFLDARKVVHCRFCANTEQLRRHGVDYLCAFHAPLGGLERTGNAGAKAPKGGK